MTEIHDALREAIEGGTPQHKKGPSQSSYRRDQSRRQQGAGRGQKLGLLRNPSREDVHSDVLGVRCVLFQCTADLLGKAGPLV